MANSKLANSSQTVSRPFSPEVVGRHHRQTLRRLLTCVLAVGCWSHSAYSEDFVVERPGVARITVHQVHLQGISTVDTLRGRIAVKLTVENLGEVQLTLNRTSFAVAYADAKELRVMAGSQQPLIRGLERQVPPGEAATGWLMLSIEHASSTEPELKLNLNCHGESLSIPLNEAMRKTSDCVVRKLGPHSSLAVITVKRPVDGFSIWLLAEKFKSVKQAGIERVVVEYLGVKDTWAVSSNSISSNSIDSWLQSAIATDEPRGLPFLRTVKSPVQFQKLFVVQPSTYRRPSYGFVNLRKPDVQSAIAASLRDVFQSVTPAELEAAFASPEAGIRQAAMETNLDRLSGDQLLSTYEAAIKDPAQQKLLARELHRSACPVALELLNQLVRRDDPEVSQAAMSSIMKSASDDAVPLALSLWNEFEGDPTWETDFVTAILKEKDYRMTPILASYAEKRLMSLTTPAPDSAVDDEEAASDTPVEFGPPNSNLPPEIAAQLARRNGGAPVETKALPGVLKFLQSQNDSEFAEVARQQLLNISDLKTQDDVLEYILDTDSTAIRQLAGDYLSGRLGLPASKTNGLTDEERRRLEQRYGPRSSRGFSKRYSKTFFDTIQRFPKPEYTERLLELAEDSLLNSSSRSMAFTAALLGASPQQLDKLLSDFETMNRLRRSQVTSSLFKLRHPKRFQIAKQNLNLSEESAQDTLRQLQLDSSLEAALLMASHLDQIRETTERAAMLAGDSDGIANRQILSYAPTMYQVTHPEVQRVLNRLEKSTVMQFYTVARQAKRSRLMSSRNRSQRIEADELRKKGENDEAEKLFRKMVESDPFDDAAMTSLASLCMRSDNATEAMELLKKVRAISPGDVETESFIALAMIRLGDVEGGLKHTELTLNEVPDLPTFLRTNALYNSACSYSRAVEQVDDKDLKKEYQEEAFRYLNLSINRESGFWDVDHALADPDLNALHEEAAWKVAIDRMRTKAEEAQQQ